MRALSAYGLNIDDLRTTISNANVNSPKGSLDGPARSWTLNANDQIQSPGAYEHIIVAYRNGRPVRLSEVAKVVQGAENTYLAGWVNDTPGIIINIQRQPGANVIQVVDRIKQLLPELSSSLPAATCIPPTMKERCPTQNVPSTWRPIAAPMNQGAARSTIDRTFSKPNR